MKRLCRYPSPAPKPLLWTHMDPPPPKGSDGQGPRPDSNALWTTHAARPPAKGTDNMRRSTGNYLSETVKRQRPPRGAWHWNAFQRPDRGVRRFASGP